VGQSYLSVQAVEKYADAGARNLLLQGERQKFLTEQWPRVYATIQRLGLTPEELQKAAAKGDRDAKRYLAAKRVAPGGAEGVVA